MDPLTRILGVFVPPIAHADSKAHPSVRRIFSEEGVIDGMSISILGNKSTYTFYRETAAFADQVLHCFAELERILGHGPEYYRSNTIFAEQHLPSSFMLELSTPVQYVKGVG